MVVHDPHRFVNNLDEDDLAVLAERLESRGKDSVFSGLTRKYLKHLTISPNHRIIEVGCGTGVVLRELARHYDLKSEIYGVDHCPSFVLAAGQNTEAENLPINLEFKVGDAHSLDFSDNYFDLVIAHTVLSHVTEPAKVLAEMARVARPNATLVIFDGDYTSLTYGFPDHEFGLRMDSALATSTFNNPRIMRDLPRLLQSLGLTLAQAWGDAVVEIGEGRFFKSFANTYAPYIKKSGLLSPQAVDIWLKEQNKAMEKRTFFAACNYYTYIIKKN